MFRSGNFVSRRVAMEGFSSEEVLSLIEKIGGIENEIQDRLEQIKRIETEILLDKEEILVAKKKLREKLGPLIAFEERSVRRRGVSKSKGTVRNIITEIMRDNGGEASNSLLRETISQKGKSASSVSFALSSLCKEGIVKRTQRGQYALCE